MAAAAQIIDLISDDEDEAFAMRVDERMGEKLKEPLHEIETSNPQVPESPVGKQAEITKWAVASNAGVPARLAESAVQGKSGVPQVPSLLDGDVSGVGSEVKDDVDEDEDEDGDGPLEEGCGEGDEGSQMDDDDMDDDLLSDIVEAVESNGDDRGESSLFRFSMIELLGPDGVMACQLMTWSRIVFTIRIDQS